MLLKVAQPLARIRAAVITSVVVHLNRTYAYLKLELLNHLHLDSALCRTSVVQSVLTSQMPEIHTRMSKAQLEIGLLSIKYSFTEMAAVISLDSQQLQSISVVTHCGQWQKSKLSRHSWNLYSKQFRNDLKIARLNICINSREVDNWTDLVREVSVDAMIWHVCLFSFFHHWHTFFYSLKRKL